MDKCLGELQGQRPEAGLGVLSVAAPSSLAGFKSSLSLLGPPSSHLLSWQVPLAEGKPLLPKAQLRLQEEVVARPAEDRGGDRREKEEASELPRLLEENQEPE